VGAHAVLVLPPGLDQDLGLGQACAGWTDAGPGPRRPAFQRILPKLEID
jgi:hypothetical protein